MKNLTMDSIKLDLARYDLEKAEQEYGEVVDILDANTGKVGEVLHDTLLRIADKKGYIYQTAHETYTQHLAAKETLPTGNGIMIKTLKAVLLERTAIKELFIKTFLAVNMNADQLTPKMLERYVLVEDRNDPLCIKYTIELKDTASEG